MVIKSLGPFLRRVRHVSGGTILADGRIVLILNPHDLIASVPRLGQSALAASPKGGQKQRGRVLVVDDSLTTRAMERNILESVGFDVTVAVDGQDAFLKILHEPFDLIVTDVEMPNMDGFQLTRRVKADKRFKNIPVILVTALESDEDKRRGIDVGADAYLTKGTFDQSYLIEAVRRLV